MRSTNIQLLRVFAAVGVVMHHLGFYAHQGHVHGADYMKLWPLRWSAFVGLPVPLFFAISGFVLTQALDAAETRDPAAGRLGRAGRFLLARVLRLYPGYWLAVALVLSWNAARGLATGEPSGLANFGAAVLTLAPVGPGPGYVLGIEWSLIYEVFLSLALGVLGLLGARALPYCAAAWLALLVWKVAAWPNFASEAIPVAATIALSAYNAPFLGGVVVYALRNAARRAGRVALGAVGLAAIGSWFKLSSTHMTLEQFWLISTVPATLMLWLAVRLPQAPSDNRYVKLGDRTYGLYLAHVPLIFLGFQLWQALGLPPRVVAGTVAVGLATLALGFQFGRLESALHARLRAVGRPRAPAPAPAPAPFEGAPR